MWLKKYWFLFLIAAVAAASLLGYGLKRGWGQLAGHPFPTPGVSVTTLPTPPTRPQSTPNLAQTLTGPAACQLKGEIKFIQHNIYNNQDAKFSYQAVDNPARNIFWTVSPADALSIGPNLFNQMELPNGESLLFITLPKKPVSKHYELTAAVQYGRVNAQGNIIVSVVKCTGKTSVVLP